MTVCVSWCVGGMRDGLPGAKTFPPQGSGRSQCFTVHERHGKDWGLWLDEGTANTH